MGRTMVIMLCFVHSADRSSFSWPVLPLPFCAFSHHMALANDPSSVYDTESRRAVYLSDQRRFPTAEDACVVVAKALAHDGVVSMCRVSF
jgi:hypothetical protein